MSTSVDVSDGDLIVVARAEWERLRSADDPELDATDSAHPAWWRGHDYVTEQWRERLAAVVTERDALRAIVEGRTTAPTPAQIELTPPVYGSAWGCLGSHLIDRLPDGQWPLLKLTFLWRSASAVTTGGVFYTGRGDDRWWDAGDPYDSAVTTSTTLVRKTFSLQIRESMLASIRVPITTGTSTEYAEHLRGSMLTAWVGFYNSSNNSASASDVVAPVLYLAPP